jgi:hypothetical protein
MAKEQRYRIAPLTWQPSRSSYRLVEAISPFATYVWDGTDKVLLISEQYNGATEKEFDDIKQAILFAGDHHRRMLEKWLEAI